MSTPDDPRLDLIIACLFRRLGIEGSLAITQRELVEVSPVRMTWNAAEDRVTLTRLAVIDINSLKLGDRVAVKCRATGRYLGCYGDRHLALYVSAQDNDLGIDAVDPLRKPSETCPVPSDDALGGAAHGISYGRRR